MAFMMFYHKMKCMSHSSFFVSGQNWHTYITLYCNPFSSSIMMIKCSSYPFTITLVMVVYIFMHFPWVFHSLLPKHNQLKQTTLNIPRVWLHHSTQRHHCWRVGRPPVRKRSHNVLFCRKNLRMEDVKQDTHREKGRERDTKRYNSIIKSMCNSYKMNNNLCKRLQSHFI